MIGNKRIKTDELETYRPHGHPRPCAGDLRQPEDVHRCQKVPSAPERHACEKQRMDSRLRGNDK
ncbi:hypothetical protein IM40_06075 [Candidatus Paracaedimonas acanthamoebae]|nr:hypothetical protein IM40_06075 [Candidatus Paracaedimonas acanthamoebae]